MSEKLDIATYRFSLFLKELSKIEKENGNEKFGEELLILEKKAVNSIEIQELANEFYNIYNKK